MAKSTKSTPKSGTDSSPPATSTQSGGNKPFHTIRYAGIKATIWQNQSEKNGPFYTVTLCRSYRDEAGEWHDTTSFHFRDLPNLAKAITDSHSWIAWQERRQSEATPK